MDGNTFFSLMNQSAPIISEKIANTIQFNGSDETNSFPVKGPDVNIVTSDGRHDVGSSKLKIKNIVNFGWDHRYYSGQLVSVHLTGVYIAYSITTQNKNVGAMRIVNRRTDDRILLKGMKGSVKDLGFAHIKDEVVIGCVDELGNLFVYRVLETASGMTSERVVEVVRDSPNRDEPHRLIWCPYLPEMEEDGEDGNDSAGKLLVITHGQQAEMWNLDTVVDTHGPGPLAPQDVTQGVLSLATADLGGNITDAAFSPDGTALATASENGEVKFFQVYMVGEGAPRCLHKWSPHDGKPLSSLFFLDNHSDYNPDIQFWKFAVTGCSKNQELKIWSCESWTCLQTIRFRRPPGDSSEIRMKAGLDLTARYLLLADIDRRLVYVHSIDLDHEGGARVVSVSEFASPAALLSFCCVSAGTKMVRLGPDGMSVEEELENGDGGVAGERREKTVVRLYLVQPKSLQECSIIYDDAAGGGGLQLGGGSSTSQVSHDSLVFQDAMSEMNLNESRDSSDNPAAVPEANDVQPASPTQVEPAAALFGLGSPDLLHSTSNNRLANSDQKPPANLPPMVASMMTPDQQLVEAASKASLPLSAGHDQLAEAASKITLMSPDQFMVEASPRVTVRGSPAAGISSGGDDDDEYVEVREDMVEVKLEEVESPAEVDTADLVSGGSSPSREVADILAEEEPRYRSPPTEEEEEEEYQSPSPTPTPVTARHNSSGVFPTPPAVVLPPAAPAPAVMTAAPSVITAAGDNDTLSRMETMLAALQHQVVQLQADQKKVTDILAAQASNNMEANIIKRVDSGMAVVAKKQLSVLEKEMLDQREAVMSAVSQTVVARLDQLVGQEFKRALPAAVSRAVEPLVRAVDAKMNEKLTATDVQLRENISKMVTSRAVMEAIADTVKEAVEPAVVNSYKQAFQQILLPNIEKAMGTLLKQINEQFLDGTKAYEASLRNHMELVKGENKVVEDKFGGQLQDLTEMVTGVAAGQTQLGVQLRDSQARVGQDAWLAAVREVVGKEVVLALARDGHSRSVSHTPAPDVNLQQTIQGHVQAGRLNEAFQTALSANDLLLVVYTCELLNTTQVFNQDNCPFTQSVLLSLIQQLSVDLQEKTELKHRYLEEAVINLDSTDATTRIHMPNIIGGLQQSLDAYIQANPNSKMTRNMKMLLLATSSLDMNTHRGKAGRQ